MSEQSRPVVLASRIVSAVAAVLGAVPTLLIEFGVIEWSGEQVAAYGTFLGVLIGAVALIFGVRVERVVTPVVNPRDNELQPLVPVAPDGPEI